MRAAMLFAVTLGVLCAGAAAETPAEIFKRASPSVFVVEVFDKAGGSVIAIGSGVAVAPDEVVTNRHVINAGNFWKIRRGGDTWDARVAWPDPDHDLALLRATGLHAPPVAFRSSPIVAVGERVYAIGAPEGLELTLSEGIVSGLREYQGGYVVQTSAPVSPGSSGGGLFDKEGQLVGITSFGLVEGQNLNFALPAGWVGALPRHSTAGNYPDQQRSAEKYKDVFLQAGVAVNSLGTMVQQFRQLHDAPYDVPPNGFGDMTVASLTINCIVDSNTSDCPKNWPAWQQAAMDMLNLQEAIRAAEPSRNELEATCINYARTRWSDVTDVYCHERPGGLYTDLEGKIRACPTLH